MTARHSHDFCWNCGSPRSAFFVPVRTDIERICIRCMEKMSGIVEAFERDTFLFEAGQGEHIPQNSAFREQEEAPPSRPVHVCEVPLEVLAMKK